MGEGFDDDTPDSGGLQPAPDRLWRHPAELGAEQAAANLAARRATGRRWPAMFVSFVGGASVVGLAWLLSSNDGVIEQRTTNLVPPASQVIIDGPISFDQWAAEIAQDNLTSVVGLHLGGDAPYKNAQAILYDTDGTLMASAHSLIGADPITAVLADGRAIPVQVIASDTVSGVAVLKIASPELPAPTFSERRVAPRDRLVGIARQTDDGELVRGVDVLGDEQVVGLPNGDLLSGLFRLSNDLDASWAGAPIVDENGGIVAMAVTSRSGTNYAIPASIARSVVYDLLTTGETGHLAWLGVHLAAGLTDEIRDERNIMGGVLVTRVWDETPAARAGLVAGDVITGVGSVNVLEGDDLKTALTAASPGELVEIRFSRRLVPDGPQSQDTSASEFSGENRSTLVTLGAQPER